MIPKLYNVELCPGEYVDDLVVKVSSTKETKYFTGKEAQRFYMALRTLWAQPNDKKGEEKYKNENT